MTIGEKTYKVNGEENTMDVVPIVKDNRTFVSVRFVAEELGYSCEPAYDTDGAIVSIILMK